MSVQVSYRKQVLLGIIGIAILLLAIEIIANVWWLTQIKCEFEKNEIFQNLDETKKRQLCLDFYEVKTSGDELIPDQRTESITINSLGFRGDEFSSIKPSDTYRIFMVGGSTMFGLGASSDETTIPGILQKIFDADNSITQKIEVINAGIQGANSETELNLIKQKLVTFSPDLVIVYDGWNDLRADFSVEYTKEAWELTCQAGKASNFDVIITLQPIAGFGNKKLTQQEDVNSFTGESHNGFQLIAAKSTYDYTGRELLSLQDNCNVVDLRGTFDDISGPIYWDQGHISDTGNLIIAEKFHEIINEIIFSKKPTESKFHNVLSKHNSPAITSHLLFKIGIGVDYTQIKRDLVTQEKKEGNYFYLKNQLGGSDKILVGKDLSKTDLSKINLTGQDLSGTDLSGQDLRKIDFTGTILRSANLSFTNLSGQDLSGKDLQGVNFRNANLENVDLSNIITTRSVQSWLPPGSQCSVTVNVPEPINEWITNLASSHVCVEIIFQNETIRINFNDANLRGVTMNFSEYGKLHYVDFSGADLTGIELSNVGLRDCKFIGTKLNDSKISSATFFLADFTNAELENSQFTKTPFFQNVSFHNAKITDAYFEKPIFIETDFSNADLKGTMINEAVMIGDNVRTCQNHQICD